MNREVGIAVVDENIRVRQKNMRTLRHLGIPLPRPDAHLVERDPQDFRATPQADDITLNRTANQLRKAIIHEVNIS